MTDRLVTKLSVQNLEYLFHPPGLPVIDKGGDAPTTSVCIVGDAGAGKTTLAVSIGQAIAAELGGIALYLTTELAPTEIKYKLSSLGLDAKALTWKHRKDAAIGDIVGRHMVLVDDGDSTAPIRRRALEAAWKQIEEEELSPPVRCVVIDAFPLPEAIASSRDDVVALVQALEGRGVSVVIVQESTGVTDYVPFITDLVFQMRFEEDPDTGERIRKLACPKSRYARSIVGPHDTGLDDGRIGVWPDPLSIARGFRVSSVELVRMFVPVDDDQIVVTTKGAIWLSSTESRGWLPRLISHTPGVAGADLRCGPISELFTEEFDSNIPDSEGPYSLAWAVVRFQARAHINHVVIHNLEGLLQRRRFRLPLEHALVSLHQLGILVCVHGETPELGPLATLATRGTFSGATPIARRFHRPAAWWVGHHVWPADARPGMTEQVLQQAKVWLDAVSQLRQELDTTAISQWHDPRLLLLVSLAGLDSHVRPRFVQFDEGRFGSKAWLQTLTGHDWDAAMVVVDALAAGKELPTHLVALWAGLTAVHAASEPALELAQEQLHQFPALLDCVIRALATQERWDEVDAAIDEVATRCDLPSYLTSAIHADSRLEGTTPEAWAEAARRLTELDRDTARPRVHCALVAHNLGVAQSRLGKLDDARACWKRAVELNPQLEIAAEMLGR